MSGTSPFNSVYVSPAQASQITGLSVRTLRRAILAERLRAHRVGRLVRIEVNELHHFMSDKANAPPAASLTPVKFREPQTDDAAAVGRGTKTFKRYVRNASSATSADELLAPDPTIVTP
jgi:excisionase family DNA binding protein